MSLLTAESSLSLNQSSANKSSAPQGQQRQKQTHKTAVRPQSHYITNNCILSMTILYSCFGINERMGNGNDL